MKILVIGASGLIGSTVIRIAAENKDWIVFGTVRSSEVKKHFDSPIAANLLHDIDATNDESLISVFNQIRPDVVINAAGLTKHLPGSGDSLNIIPINALMPHRLARLCELVGARLIHISTDCVFSGKTGCYLESDLADSRDVYGLSKLLGEVDYPHAVTLRTSTIGHELQTKYGLLDWFLSQEESCKGYSRAIFSGLPTITLAQIIRDVVIPNVNLRGLYHVSGNPISKYDLLMLIADVYGKSIDIIKDDDFSINRSLNSERFTAATGYISPEWPELISQMYSYK